MNVTPPAMRKAGPARRETSTRDIRDMVVAVLMFCLLDSVSWCAHGAPAEDPPQAG
jgi:hypothetical protein